MIDEGLIESYKRILKVIELLGYDIDNDNFRKTPQRCARAFRQFVFPLDFIKEQVISFFNTKFEDNADEMIVATNISVISLCPHHLLPVEMKVWVGYIPDGFVLGLSKLIRVSQMLGNQPILQETYATQLANAIQDNLKPKGVGVYVRGKHGCMKFRGVRANDTDIITSKVLGNFKLQPATREEFLAQCRH